MKRRNGLRLALIAALYLAHHLLVQRLAGLDPIGRLLGAHDVATLALLAGALLLRLLCVIAVPAWLAAHGMARLLRWHAGRTAETTETRYNSPPS